MRRFATGTTDQYIYFVAVDSVDLITRETGLTTFTVVRSRNGAADVTYTTPTIAEVDATTMPGVYTLLLDEDMTIGSGNDSEEVCLHITQASMAPVTIIYELYRREVTGGETITVSSGAVSTVSSVTAIATGGITAGSIAADAIGASELAADAVAEIADAVWDEDATGHQTTGTFGQAIGDPAANTATIYAATVTNAAGTDIAADIIAIKAETAAIVNDTDVIDDATSGLVKIATDVAAILVDTSTTLQGELDGIQADTEDIQTKIGTPSDLGGGATLAANLSDIEAQTDDIGVAGAGLTAINLPDQTMNITGNITGNVSGSVGSVAGNVDGNVTGSVGSLATQAKADVNGEVVDALNVDSYGEPTGVPAVSASLAEKIGRQYMVLRNRVDVTASKLTVYDDGDAAEWEKDLSDDGTTYSESEANSV